jgi:hypothetical protein
VAEWSVVFAVVVNFRNSLGNVLTQA